ncbi:MAG: 3-oxoacyl-ACP synthase III family protein [Limisphaerales bacterium]
MTVVPANERSFVEEMKNFNFPEARSLKLKEVMGYDKRRLVEPGVCVSDLAVFGLQHLFDSGLLKRDEIDALIVITQTPDYIIPGTSCIIHGRLGLKRDMLSMSISQACTGFVIGLIQGFMLLEQESIKKVVLVNSDVLSRKVSQQDRNIYPLVGDACAITVLERDLEDSVIHANVRVDGSRAEALMIPAGGMRQPSTQETARLEDAGDGNLRAKDHLFMDGAAIFNFVQTEVPPLIESLLAHAGVSTDAVDYFLCHQPNRFMLEKLADKMKIPHAKMPNNVVENFGNNSGVSIPTVMTFNLRERLLREKLRVCLAGFGAGLTWAAMLLNIGKFDFNSIIEYK